MKRLALLAALVVALPAPALAQESAPVVGAGSFTTAPILEPGTYRDTALPEEYLFYGVRVAAGQRLRVTLEAGMPVRELNDLGVISLQVNLHSPDRSQLFGLTGDSSTVGSDSNPAELVTDAALPSEQARTAHSQSWVGPGVYFFAVYAITFAGVEVSQAQIPIEFTVALEGQPVEDPTPTSTPSPTATATAAAAPEAASEGDDTPMAAAGAGVGGLLVGVVGAIALRQRRR